MYYPDQPEKASTSKHRTYSIKDGDTLASVSKVLGIPARELRRYHNTYCPIEDLIEADFKSYLEVVLLPLDGTYVKYAEVEQRSKVAFGPNYKLPFLPNGLNNKYNVQYTTEVGEKRHTFSSKISVKWLAVDKNKFHLFEINRDPTIFINKRAPDTMIEELAAKTAEIIYPLKIIVDRSGKWIDIYNYEDIIDRWKIAKREILNYYIGEVIQKYINQTEYALYSSKNLLKSLSSDYFLRTFFSGIHVSYSENYSFTNTIYFPIVKNEESEFNVIQKVSTYLDDLPLIRVEQKGEYVDTIFNKEFGYPQCAGNCNASYLLNSVTNCIEKANVELSVQYDDPIKVSIAIETYK